MSTRCTLCNEEFPWYYRNLSLCADCRSRFPGRSNNDTNKTLETDLDPEMDISNHFYTNCKSTNTTKITE